VVALRPADAEAITRVAEEPANVRREVREELARIRILGPTAGRELRAEAVHVATAVGVDETADELVEMSLHDRLLPKREDDRAGVLAARPDLGKNSDQRLEPAVTSVHRSCGWRLTPGVTSGSHMTMATTHSSTIPG